MLQVEGAAKAAGYMSKIPTDLIDSLGGEYLVGWASNYSISSRYSQGPSLHVFTPQEAIDAVVTVDKAIKTQTKMVFPLEDGKQLVEGSNLPSLDISPIWGPSSEVRYGFIIPGTTMFMAIGSHQGIHSGIGYKITQDTGRVCGGYCPYEANDIYSYFWLFDINELIEAQHPWDVTPISYGKWSHPYDDAGSNVIIGATFDDETSTLYLSLEKAGKLGKYDSPPLIIAYNVKAKQ
jgi:hypothetical protein